MKRCLLIAEAGVNHNGSIEIAKDLVRAAADAGADAVKFQTFNSRKIVTGNARKARYQEKSSVGGETHLEMLQRLELSFSEFHCLRDLCENLGIEFLSTAFDDDSLEFLVREIGVERLKIPSGEITNAPLLLKHAQKNKEIILSTGMSSLGDIETALTILAYGFLGGDAEAISLSSCYDAYCTIEAQKHLKEKVTLLHCSSEYPAPLENINLHAMRNMNLSFGLPVGLSDHSLGFEVPIAAVALGATIIEKHFTLDTNMHGPDHASSLNGSELEKLVEKIRNTEMALGDGLKYPRGDELDNRQAVRKYVVASRPIANGEAFSLDNITVKRGGQGLPATQFWSILGKKSSRDLNEDDPILE